MILKDLDTGLWVPVSGYDDGERQALAMGLTSYTINGRQPGDRRPGNPDLNPSLRDGERSS